MSFQKRSPILSIKPDQIIDYKDIGLLRSFLNEQGKLLARRSTRLTLKQQRQLSRSVKRARSLKLLSLNGIDL